MVQSLDDDAGREKEQSFEKGMSHEMKDRGRPGTNPQRQEHVADLADRGIREDPLDVRLRERTETSEEQRRCADHRYSQLHGWRQGVQHMGPRNEVDARGYHRRGMDQGAGRRWAS